MAIFYRVSKEETQQGVWYDIEGKFTGLIHDKFNFCKHNKLVMDFDPEIVGYLSATDDLEKLFEWFPKEDIIKLQEHGWFIHKYESEDFRFYERFQHYIINQNNMKVLEKIVLS